MKTAYITRVQFLPRDKTQSAVLLLQVVRLFACPSVTLWYCDRIGWATSTLITHFVRLRSSRASVRSFISIRQVAPHDLDLDLA